MFLNSLLIIATFSIFLWLFFSTMSDELVALTFIWLKSITLQQSRSYVSVIGIPGGKKLLTSLFIPSCMKLAPWPQLEMPDTLNVSFFIWYNHNSSGICTSWQNSLVKMTMFYFVTTIVSISSVVSESLKSLNSTCPCSLSSFVHTLNCP